MRQTSRANPIKPKQKQSQPDFKTSTDHIVLVSTVAMLETKVMMLQSAMDGFLRLACNEFEHHIGHNFAEPFIKHLKQVDGAFAHLSPKTEEKHHE